MTEEIVELSKDIGRLEGKLDVLIMQLTEHIRKDEIAWERVTDLEKKIIWVAGAASGLVFLITSGLFSILKKMGIA